MPLNDSCKSQQAMVDQVQQGLRSAQVRSHCQSIYRAVGSLASVSLVIEISNLFHASFLELVQYCI